MSSPPAATPGARPPPDARAAGEWATLRAAYERDGHVVRRRLVDPDVAADLRRAVANVIAAGAGRLTDAVIRGAHYHVQTANGRRGGSAVVPGVFRKVVFPSRAEPRLARWLRDGRLLGAVRALGLENPRCVVDQINPKAPLVGTGFPWHQDAAFLPPTTQRLIAEHGGVNVALALDASTEESGALAVLPGTHRLGPVDFPYDTGDGAETDAFGDTARRILVEQEPGDALFFHPLLAHGSGPNASDRERIMLTWWFVHDPGGVFPLAR
jgi:ectoine hydroxylase-related dioxygenase (phytanoyl-CoA dioxygenase family)